MDHAAGSMLRQFCYVRVNYPEIISSGVASLQLVLQYTVIRVIETFQHVLYTSDLLHFTALSDTVGPNQSGKEKKHGL